MCRLLTVFAVVGATAIACAKPAAEVATLDSSDLVEYESQPERVRKTIDAALALTKLKLGYQYGSHDPEKGGMDCSGTIYHLLRSQGVKSVPRQANLCYRWLWLESQLQPVVSTKASTFELGRLRPGDLLFWTGTYTVDRDPPVTHVMFYLGTEKATGKRVMFGASSGRRYAGKARHGVSVFDFVIPKPVLRAGSRSRFVAYGSVPGIRGDAKRGEP